MENKREPIGFCELAQIAIEYKKEVISIIAGCTILAAGISFVLPPQYESTTLVQTRSAGKDIGNIGSVAAMMGISGGSRTTSPVNYIGLMKSRHVLGPIIDKMDWQDEKDKPEAEKFAKKYLEITNISQTNLIKVTATAKSPEEAQMISQGVVDNFLAMQTDMNQQTQSLLIKFLNTRIENAKEEADAAAAKLADYSREHKIYAPEDQAKLALEKLNTYDKAISEVVVNQKSAQAEYDTATAKIGQQKAGAKAYNINDNATVQKIRASIVEKQMELVGYQEKYTDEHPQVKQAKLQLQDLNRKLEDEVNAVVSSNAATLNTAYATLLTNQAVAEAKAGAATASKEALENKKAEVEKEMDDLPEAVMNYIQLESDAKLKQEVYLSLVKQCEQDKVQEAMESMDIQIIDSANLPDKDKPAAPRKKIFALAGFFIGSIMAIFYTLRICKRKEAV